MKKNKKIAIIYSGAKNQGGIEVYLLNLLNNYKGTDIKFFVISLGIWPILEKINVNKYILARSSLNIFNFLRIIKYIRKQEIDLLVSHGMVSRIYCKICSLFIKAPHLATIHSDYKNEYSNKCKLLSFLFAELVLGRITTRYIAVSNFLKNELIKSGVGSNKIDVVHNGIDFNKLNCNYSVNNNKKALVLGSVGRLHKVKGYDLLIKAFSKIEDKNMFLYIWGKGEERENLQSIINKLGLQEKVFLRGEEEFKKIVSQIDIYVQPSRSEGFGLAVVQAMGCGIPVVVTPAGSLPEIINNGKTGMVTKSFFVDDICASLNELIGNKKLREEISKNAYVVSRKNFGLDKWVDKTINKYLEAAK